MPAKEEPIGFLFSVVNRCKGLRFRSLLSSSGLTPRQYGVLARLWDEDGLPLHDLANRLYVDQTSLSRTLHAMEQNGLLRRSRDPGDRRVCRFFLTEKGAQMRQSLLPGVIRHNESLLEGFSANEVRTMRRMLKKMITNLERNNTDESTDK